MFVRAVLTRLHWDIWICLLYTSYRIVVADSRSPRDGRFIEEIGYYNPMEEPKVVKVDADKAKDWISKGAQPTDTVKTLFKKHGVL